MSQQAIQKRETALTPVSNSSQALSNPSDEIDVFKLGDVLARSGYFQDARDAAQCVVKVLAGRELGFGAIASMSGIHIIQGKPSLSANLIAAAVKRSGKYDYRVLTLDDELCKIEFFQGRESIGISEFSMQDAKVAGALEGPNKHSWKKFPRNMLFARAMSNGVRWYTPEVSNGPVYIPDELDVATDETGAIIVGASSTARSEPEKPSAKKGLLKVPTEIAPEIEDMREKIRAACQDLGYDEKKTEKALARTDGMTLKQMEVALNSLKKLKVKQSETGQKMAEMRAEINSALEAYGWDEQEKQKYLDKNYEGKKLEEMNFAELNKVYVELDLDSEKGEDEQ